MPQPNVEAWVQGLRIGQYVLVRELARGGMGEIWLARQTGAAGFDRLVVLKRVIQSNDDDPANLTMFLDEARIASQLHHPNIVQIFELQNLGPSVFLVMEYLPGQTVSRLARRTAELGKLLPPGISVTIVAAAARGLGYAHRRKDLDGRAMQIVHRDVSPQNLFVTYDGQVKLLDFGIALAAGRMAKTSTGTLKGKVAYMSPEQALGEPLTGASDVYALGIVLFEALTGTRYYGKADEVGILRQLAMKTPPVLPSSRARIDAELEAIVVRALAPEPAERFSDGQVFFEALDGWLRTHPVATGALESAMSAVFSDELRTLVEVHRLASLTPASASNSMPHAPGARPPPSRRTALGVGALALFIGGAVMVALLSARGVPNPAPEPALVMQPEPPPIAQLRPDEVDGGAVPTAAEAVAAVELVDAGLERPRGVRAPVATTGRLTLDTEPWTGVFLGKRKLGDTPLIDFTLPAGSHRLRLVNAEEHLDTIIEVTIKPRETTEKRLAF